ncbi:hypothetical protein HWV62_43315 [Athelia sp. TMB]|nr:hypothetical protein HWV62_43315 [Athelia sp. TMB]
MEEPTAIFTSYENEFAQLIDSVKQALEQDGSGTNGAEAKKAALRRVEISLDEADDLVSPVYCGLCTRTKRYEQLSQMQIEIQGIPTSIRGTYSSRLKRAQTDLARYKKLSREAHAATRNSTSGGGWLRGLGGRGKADPADDAERGDSNQAPGWLLRQKTKARKSWPRYRGRGSRYRALATRYVRTPY